MAKYSTGGVGGDSSGACELCGAEGRSLETATVAGATLEVCSECRKHGEQSGSDPDERQKERKRRKETVQNVARLDDARSADTDWEEGTDYQDDPLPYLVDGYGAVLETARQDAGLGTDDLAAEIDADEADILAIEQGRASRAGVGGSLIETLEEYLGIELADE
jgi:ribosome-binding protein aMBF1 (putative translation factor)